MAPLFHHHHDAPVPEDWADVVARHVWFWSQLDEGERGGIGDAVHHLVGRNRWEAANGFELTDEMRVVIAAQAGLLVLGLDLDHFDKVGSIVVHPTTVVSRGEHRGPAPGVVSDQPVDLLGEAELHGPVVLAWDSVLEGAHHPEAGRNVVLHELAHKLDMLDDLVDGTPPMPDAELRDRWIEVCTAAFGRLRAGPDPVLDDYGATDVGEFFAVATEAFFTRPVELHGTHPDLYEVYAAFYRQDPAARAGRTAASG